MDVAQWILLGVLGLLIICYPILMLRRNKKESQKFNEMQNSLKRGDKILTNAGVYGKIIDLKQDGDAKKVIIETGDGKNVSYLTIDAYAIYTILNDKPVEEPKKVEEKKEVKKADEKASKGKSEEVKTEVKAVKVEEKK